MLHVNTLCNVISPRYAAYMQQFCKTKMWLIIELVPDFLLILTLQSLTCVRSSYSLNLQVKQHIL